VVILQGYKVFVELGDVWVHYKLGIGTAEYAQSVCREVQGCDLVSDLTLGDGIGG
jgi:hypothetical protein